MRCLSAILLVLVVHGPSLAEDPARRALNQDDPFGEIGDRGVTFPLRSDDSPFPPEPSIRRFKKQALQSVAISGGGLFSTNGNDLNSSYLENSVGVAIPLGSFDNILTVSPSFRVDWIEADSRFDVPSELFDAGVQFFWRKTLNDRWSVMAIVRPSIRSDFSTSDEAFRLFGLGLFTWQYRPEELSFSFGAVSLGRADIPLLPAIGLTWTPQPITRLDLRFPESRLSYRLAKAGAERETWTYLSAGLGGNTWAVTRQSGRSDEFSLRDWRVKWGIETIVDGGGGWFAEVGYAFARRLEYERSSQEISLSDGLVIQAGWRY